MVVGGFAVGFHGYPRATGDMDVWVAVNPANLRGLGAVLRSFGFTVPEPSDDFLVPGEFLGIGNSPIRIEVLSLISGVSFSECYAARTTADIEGVQVNFIGLEHLRINKRASARFKDLNDLQNLPE